MDEQRLETRRREVRLQLASGECLEGEIFLQLLGARGIGAQRVGELLNGAELFLPLSGDDRVTLVNLHQVVSLTVDAEQEADELSRLGFSYSVKVTPVVGEAFSAVVYINLPSDRGRVKDFLNQRQRFLPFFTDQRVVYLNYHYILKVED